jgi:hypothetical protein
MRTQYCRDHIDAVAEGCDLDNRYVNDVKSATVFVDEHSAIADCATTAILTLMRIPDPEVKALTISHVENALKEKTPTGGTKRGGFTENQVKAFKARFELQVSAARQKEATRLRKEAEKKYAEVREITDAEEKKRENAESLGVVLKVKDPITESKRSEAKKELDRLNSLLEEQSARRKEQERILKDVEAKYATRLERVGVCKAGLKKAEDEVRETLGYRNSIMKEIRIIDDNSRITSGKIAEQAKLLV